MMALVQGTLQRIETGGLSRVPSYPTLRHIFNALFDMASTVDCVAAGATGEEKEEGVEGMVFSGCVVGLCCRW